MKHRSTPIALVALMLFLAGCGAQSLAPQTRATGVAAAREATAFFPANPRGVWQYEVTAHPADDPYVDYKGTETVAVESVERKAGTTTLKLRAIDDFTNRYRFPVITESAEGVRMTGVEYWGTAASSVDDLAIDFLRFPLTKGKKWDDGLWVGEAKGLETVTVPAGTFKAWKVYVIGTHESAYTAVGHYWVAPGTGIVKSDLSIPGWNIESVMIPAGYKVKRGLPLPKTVKFGR